MSRIPRLLATFAVLAGAVVLAACGNPTVTTTDAGGVTRTNTIPFGSPIVINVSAAASAPASVTLDGSSITGRTETLKVHEGDNSTVRVAGYGQPETVLKIQGVPARTHTPQAYGPPPPRLLRPAPPPCGWEYGPPVVDRFGAVVSYPEWRCPL